MEDEDRPRPPKRWIEPISLTPLSVADLNDYIAALHVEITRATAAIDGKQSSKALAEGFFKKGS